jgi:C-terminal processing protease CtpA/Prc
MDAIVTPAVGAKAYDRPIVVLTDRYTASMAEITAMAFRSLPGIKVTIVGDTTAGANGPLSPSVDLFNGGQFTFAGFGFVYTSSAAYRYNGVSYEGQGYPPDVYIPFVYAPGFGTDRQLDEAIRLLK